MLQILGRDQGSCNKISNVRLLGGGVPLKRFSSRGFESFPIALLLRERQVNKEISTNRAIRLRLELSGRR